MLNRDGMRRVGDALKRAALRGGQVRLNSGVDVNDGRHGVDLRIGGVVCELLSLFAAEKAPTAVAL